MASLPAQPASNPGLVAAHHARVADHGSGNHAYLDVLANANGPFAARDLADAVHLLCAIHGNFPGLTDMVMGGTNAGPVRNWLRDAADTFERERLFLVRLTSAVGPMPSTPGAAQTEAALSAQRHAIETLAKSERRGCALGAAVALIHDWQAVRTVLDHAAERTGIDRPGSNLPDEESIEEVILIGTDGLASERAFAFGAEQLLLQHRALFDLLQARADAREDY